MQGKKIVSSILAGTLLLGACAAPKGTTANGSAQGASSNSIAMEGEGKGVEHCLSSDKNTCFLELDHEGKSQFFATGESYTKLLVDPILAEIHIDMQPTDGDNYSNMRETSGASQKKVVYEGQESNGANVYSSSVDDSGNFIFLIFRIVSFLWKGAGYVDSAVTIGGIVSKIGSKLGSFKDKLKAKLGIGSSAGEKAADGSNSASDITARITWHYGEANRETLTKEMPIPSEYVTVTAAEKKAAEEAAAEVEAEIKAEEAAAQMPKAM